MFQWYWDTRLDYHGTAQKNVCCAAAPSPLPVLTVARLALPRTYKRVVVVAVPLLGYGDGIIAV